MPYIPTTTLTQGGGAMVQLFDSHLGADTASFDVSGISQAYNSLIFDMVARGANASAQEDIVLIINNDSGANYDYVRATVTGASAFNSAGIAGATSALVGYVPAASATANYAGSISGEILSYTNTVFHKQVRTKGTLSVATFYSIDGSAIWHSTAAINRLTFTLGTGNFLAGSRLTIYGLL